MYMNYTEMDQVYLNGVEVFWGWGEKPVWNELQYNDNNCNNNISLDYCRLPYKFDK